MEAVLPDGMDPGIAPFVRALASRGIETFESCQGGDGHTFHSPTIRFHGSEGAGHIAVGIAIELGMPVRSLRRTWDVIDDVVTGPHWELVFCRAADEGLTVEAWTSGRAA
jgi:hypothetical protein